MEMIQAEVKRSGRLCSYHAGAAYQNHIAVDLNALDGRGTCAGPCRIDARSRNKSVVASPGSSLQISACHRRSEGQINSDQHVAHDLAWCLRDSAPQMKDAFLQSVFARLSGRYEMEPSGEPRVKRFVSIVTQPRIA